MNKDYYNFSYYNFKTGEVTTLFKYNTQSKFLRDGNNSNLKPCPKDIRKIKIEKIIYD